VKKSPARKRNSEERLLVLESDETLLSSILSGLHQVAPSAVVDVARDVDEADKIAADEQVALFVFDLDAASEPNVVRDLRNRHPEGAGNRFDVGGRQVRKNGGYSFVRKAIW
jgi:hypothetical protein